MLTLNTLVQINKNKFKNWNKIQKISFLETVRFFRFFIRSLSRSAPAVLHNNSEIRRGFKSVRNQRSFKVNFDIKNLIQGKNRWCYEIL